MCEYPDCHHDHTTTLFLDVRDTRYRPLKTSTMQLCDNHAEKLREAFVDDDMCREVMSVFDKRN